MRDSVRDLYFSLLARGIPKWIILFFVIAIGSGTIVAGLGMLVFAFSQISKLGKPLSTILSLSIIVLIVAGVMATVFHNEMPDDPRKKKEDE